MANWRPVDVRVWNDRKFLAGGDDARLLWLFLLTCPSLPIPGVVVGGDAALAELLGWTTERLRDGFAELSRNGLQVRRESRIVWLPNALRYQPCAGPNAIKCWGKKWDDVPEGHLKLELWEALRISCKSWSVLFSKLFSKPFHDPIPDPSGTPSNRGSQHDHKHDHQHQHDQEDPPPARAIPPTAAERTAVRDQLRAELETARSRAAAARGVAVKPLLAFDRGIDSDLNGHLALAATSEALAATADQARHAIAMAELEVTHGGKSFEWFTGAIFAGGNFARLSGMTPDDAKRERAGPRSGAPRSPRRIEHPKLAEQLAKIARLEADEAARGETT